MSVRTNRWRSRCRSRRLQSSQLTSLSWQYALLLPRWVRRISSPIWSIGVPIDISRMTMKFLTWRRRSCSICRILGRPLDPAIPGQVRLLPVPVSFAIRLVVLVVVGNQIVQREAVVAGHEIDALFGLPFLVADRCLGCRAARCANNRTVPLSPLTKRRTSSRNRPFHSFQLSPMKLPT